MIEFVAYGIPGPQGSKRYVGHSVKKNAKGGKATATMVESSKKVKPWRKSVETAAISAILDAAIRGERSRFPLDGPLVARMVFTLPKPATAKGRKHPYTTPDLSKLCRSTEDALKTAGLIADDARIVEYLRLAKVYPGGDPEALDRPGVRIRIESITEGE